MSDFTDKCLELNEEIDNSLVHYFFVKSSIISPLTVIIAMIFLWIVFTLPQQDIFLLKRDAINKTWVIFEKLG